MKTIKTFEYGSTWLKADFHLHTKKDKEFQFSGEEHSFIAAYIEKLKGAHIQIGLVTNHNKFDMGEFKDLRKKAQKEEIFLLPGIELSVKDGKNGIHTLVIFSEEWLKNNEGNSFINDFLNVAFAGQSNYHNKNARSNHDILETIRELDTFEKDYFIIFAHVEANNGLWGGLSGGRIQELGKNEFFKKRTLGFQNVLTHDVPDRVCRTKVQKWLREWYPAEVEGSDCKRIDQIGEDKFCYLKIGDFTFEAVKYALIDYNNRVSETKMHHSHSHILSISFEGAALDGRNIKFSPGLNVLIGIRGSGKSSILEAIRYTLGIPFGEKAMDRKYKQALIGHIFGSGGKAIVRAIDQHGQIFEVRRILNDQPEVFVNDKVQPGVSIRETILNKPVYFGQKDLSSSGAGFETDLVEKLVGEKLYGIRQKIDQQKQIVNDCVDRLFKLQNVEILKKEYETKQQDAEFRLKKYREHDVEEKLQKQVDFESDSRKIRQIIDFLKIYLNELSELINRFEDDLKNHRIYKSKENSNFFNRFFANYDKLLTAFFSVRNGYSEGLTAVKILEVQQAEFEETKKGFKEEFAKIERSLATELKAAGAQTIRSDEFLRLKKVVAQAKAMLKTLYHQQSQKLDTDKELVEAISKLNKLWHEEFEAIKSELEKINENQTALKIVSKYKEDKEAFLTYMKDMFKGSRIRENTLKTLINEYSDFGNMYNDFTNVLPQIGGSTESFSKYFDENLKALLTFQVPNQFVIKYHNKELKHHSLGQRASALILFVLSQKENSVIMIDQPEDDLDNLTIFEDVIKLIRTLKDHTQFIFATHNANIPVLGDSEQIHSCFYSDDRITLKSGSIDNPLLQKEIVDIMEGGQEAFNRRKEIYRIWKPRNY